MQGSPESTSSIPCHGHLSRNGVQPRALVCTRPCRYTPQCGDVCARKRGLLRCLQLAHSPVFLSVARSSIVAKGLGRVLAFKSCHRSFSAPATLVLAQAKRSLNCLPAIFGPGAFYEVESATSGTFLIVSIVPFFGGIAGLTVCRDSMISNGEDRRG